MPGGSLPAIAQVVAAAVAVALLSLLLYVAVRRLVVRLTLARVRRRVERATQVLRRHEAEQYASMDRLLFQLGELHDTEAVEAALARVLEEGAPEQRAKLRQVYASLDVVGRYVRDLREGTRWRDRAHAAGMLGQLGVAEAIPDLVRLMRDPHEDARTVKLAAARALGQMEAAEAIPLLVEELDDVDEWASPRIAEVLVRFGPAACPALLQALCHEGAPNARVWAAQILGRIGDVAAAGPLIALLRDRNNQVRLSAAESLGRLGTRQAVDALIQVATHDPASPVRAEAARALGAIHDQKAIESLVLLLSDPDYWTRLRAIEAIELIGPRDATCLEDALRDPAAAVRQQAAVALERVGALDRSVNDLASDDPRIRDRAHRLLVEMGRAGLTGSILALLEHDDFRVRTRIVSVIADIGDPQAAEALTPLTADPLWPVRATAIDAIARLSPTTCLPQVVAALSDDEETVRAAAIDALKSLDAPLGDDVVARALPLFANQNAVIRASVVGAIGAVRHPDVDAMLERAIQDANADVRRRAVEAVADRRDPIWLARLEDRLADTDNGIRIAAVRGLQQIGTRRALQAVVSSLTTTDTEFREALSGFMATYGVGAVRELAGLQMSRESTLALIWALGKTADVEALSELTRFAGSDDPLVRASTVGALAKIRHPRSSAFLLEMLGDCNERVRAAAVNALGRTGLTVALEPLLERLDDPDGFVRERVPLSLGRIGGPQAKDAVDVAAARARDARGRAYVAAGYALCGVASAFDRAVALLADGAVRGELDALLRRESADLARRIRGNLRLDGAGEENRLGEDELRANYAAILRSDRHPVQRAAAVKALRALGAAPVVDLLLNAVVADPAPDVRRLAVDALTPLLREANVQGAFLQALRDPNVQVQIAAAEGLGATADPRHNLHLLHAFTCCEAGLDEAIVGALAANNAVRVTAFIDELMGHDDPLVLRGGARVVGALGDARALGLLGVWVEADDPGLRAAAAEALGALGTIEARRALLRTLADPNETVRLATARALGRLPGQEIHRTLVDLCSDPSPRVRMALADVVRTRRDVGALDLAAKLTRDPHVQVRAAALLALLQIGDGEATRRFLAYVDGQPTVVRSHLAALPDVTAAADALAETATQNPAPEARQAALRALLALGRPRVDVLLAAFGDPSPTVRVAAIEVANGVQDDPTLREALALQEGLARLIRDPAKEVRDAVRRSAFTVEEAG